ncbi:MAG: DUF4339 domain-containing protein [Gemmataceae bacterium]|nr:DUF4339 domain-containing protein [Gemmataceae bacterium]
MADEWYYAKNGQQLGPVSRDELKQYTSAGQLRPNDLVWTEGMANWAPAQTVPGLFPAIPTSRPVRTLAAETYRLNDVENPARPPVRPLERDYGPEEDEEEEEERPRYRRRRSSSGANPVLIAVGALVGILVVVGGIILIATLARQRNPDNPTSFSLRKGTAHTLRIKFPANTKAEVWVTSQFDSDVDIFVHDSDDKLVVRDEGLSKDCYVTWHVPREQIYKVEVVNRVHQHPVMRHRNRDNECSVRYSPAAKE